MRRELGMTIALVVMCLGLYISNPDFLGQSNSINTLRQISMLGIFAMGIGFVIIAGGIDLSIGSVIGLTGVLIAKLSSTQLGGLGYPLWIGIPVALGVALLIGLGQGLLITRLKLQPFIVTLGGMLFLRGVSQTIAQGGTLSLGGSPLLALANGGLLKSGSDALVPYPLLMFLAVSAVATYALHFTVFGRYVYAIGGNRDAAEYSGINVRRVETSTYVISAGLGGVAGVCYASYIGQMSQQVGIAYEMYAIAAAVLGGCSLRGGEGTVLGIIIGSAVMRVIDNGINMFQLPYQDADRIQRIWRLDPNWTFIIIGAVILVAVILDQIVHMVQTKRRIRHASAGAAEAAPSLQAAAAVSAAESPAARAPDRESA
ncbi:ABC transporter permease [Sorangium sp. So ce381]|uniref:ABC transporter permease n=1 Tax=Sorangium sp. So ce381 TaxID=3133307 RepID=UPI003F5AE387